MNSSNSSVRTVSLDLFEKLAGFMNLAGGASPGALEAALGMVRSMYCETPEEDAMRDAAVSYLRAMKQEQEAWRATLPAKELARLSP